MTHMYILKIKSYKGFKRLFVSQVALQQKILLIKNKNKTLRQ